MGRRERPQDIRTFDHIGYSKRLSRAFTGLDFNYESMEDELTCPVCLELYADPLMLPCSHSVCKKCLQDIASSAKHKSRHEGIECPSCRKVVELERHLVGTLPRNLALENIVIRYTEERSKSIRKSLSLESPVSDYLISPLSETSDLPEFPTDSKTVCELCETQAPTKAAWYCVQCEVSYCHACFGKFHPRRGTLARHKVRQPLENEHDNKPEYCVDHCTEVASIFCDKCKVLICSLCMCEDEGKHGGHKVLAPDSASKRIKETAQVARDHADVLLATLREQRGKIEALQEEMQDLHKDTCERVEQQYSRLIDDITAALSMEKKLVLGAMETAKVRSVAATDTFVAESTHCADQLQRLNVACEELCLGRPLKETLSKAQQVAPLEKQLEKARHDLDAVTRRYEAILKDRVAQGELSSAVEQFRSSSLRTLKALLNESTDHCNFIIPHIKSPTSPGKSELVPRVQNKYLITWGFSSTSFTGEQLVESATWTITIERHTGQWGNWNTGYLFGVGVSSEPLNVKDLVGMNPQSYGIICTGGSLFYSHENEQQHLLSLCSLPISVTMTVSREHPDYTIVSYKLAPAGQGTSLVGKRIISDGKLKKSLYPVFTVSQRVKLVFPTFV